MNDTPSWLTRLILPMPATLGKVNVYLIQGPSGVALIDTGMSDASSRKTLHERLHELNLTMEQIRSVVCTHHHADHAGLGELFLAQGASVYLSEPDAHSLVQFHNSNGDSDRERAGFGRSHPLPEGFVDRVAPLFPFFRTLGEPFQPTAWLTDGQTLDMGGIPFEVVITPGHTHGHACLYQPDAKLMFTGDCVLSNDATHMSMRPETRGTNPLASFFKSLERLNSYGSIVAWPGHGEPIEDLSVRTAELINHHYQRLNQFADALTEQPQTAYQLCETVMGQRPKIIAMWLCLSQTLGYLEHLVHAQQAEIIWQSNSLHFRRS